MEYMNVQQAAEIWGISGRRVRILCNQGKVPGCTKKGHSYQIPRDAVKPADGRQNRHRQIPNQFTSIFAQVDSLKRELNQYYPLPSHDENRLWSEFLIEYTYNSNAIEGNTLTLQETARVLDGTTIEKKPLKDHLEVVGHRDACIYILDLVKDKIPFSEDIIKHIDTLVLIDKPEERGIYRSIPKKTMGDFYELPDPLKVPELMESLIKELDNKKIHPIENAAIFHMEFRGIQPFVDGNGHTSRLLLNLFLMQNNYPPINMKYVDYKRYCKAFECYFRDGSPYEMIKMISNYLEEQLRKALYYLNNSYIEE